jgi:serine protease AprX
MVQQLENSTDRVYFEAVVSSQTGVSMFAPNAFLQGENLQEFTPPPGRAVQAARILQSLGFRVQHIGTFSVSAEGSRELWEQVFSTRVELRNQPVSDTHPELGEVSYLSHVADAPFTIPEELMGLVERAYPQIPPILFGLPSPIPPRVPYHHLRVPDDIALICRASHVHKEAITGKGVLLAMVDTGFYKHPFYKLHGYNYNATLAPDATRVEKDENGHGTAEAANVFANAPGIDFIGVKTGRNSTLGFKVASDLYPAVMTNSWGYQLRTQKTLPNFLKPLEAAVIEAVRNRGIVVCFSAGNGQIAFPGMMPDVISVGGVYAHDTLDGDDFLLEASDYASSFTSKIYPGRNVPDVCGLVGMKPRAIYIMLPVEPENKIDKRLGGAGYPEKDETAVNDGWAVISGTSAASPQIAGVCALLKQVQPGLSPDLVKSILKASARDVKKGTSATGEVAGEGLDGATGAGLVDAYAAYKLARSVTLRNLTTLPAPR